VVTSGTRGLLPTVLGALAFLGAGFLVLPVAGLVLRSPWTELGARIATPSVGEALRISVATSLGALVLATVVGVPLAWVLARTEFVGKGVLRALCLLPMVLPPVVGGVALLLAFGRRGLVGGVLYEAFGVALPFSPAGVVLAQAFVAMPFLVVTVEAGLRSAGDRPREGEFAFEFASRAVGTDVVAVRLDRRLPGDGRVAPVRGTVPTGSHRQGLQLVAVEHLRQPGASVCGRLLGDADAARAAGEFDEQVGRFGLLAGALFHAEASGSRPGIGLLEFEDGVEPSLAVGDDRDPEVVAVLVTEQGVDLPDLL
jgi:hypothetical protein